MHVSLLHFFLISWTSLIFVQKDSAQSMSSNVIAKQNNNQISYGEIQWLFIISGALNSFNLVKRCIK